MTSVGSRTESPAESSMTWADGALLAIDQRALPRVLSWLRLTTVDEVIDAIKTLAIPGWTPQRCAEASIKLRPT